MTEFLPEIPADLVTESLMRMPGNEIKSGKIDGPESTAALVANAFGWFLGRAKALPELRGVTMSEDGASRRNSKGGINADVITLSQRFAMLMAEYNQAIGDGKISINEAKRLLRETLAIQQVLLEMKLNLEEEAS